MTKADIHREVLARRLMWHPVNTAADLMVDEHLRARDFWVEVEDPATGRRATYPGLPMRFSLTPGRVRCRAPRLGQHNREVYVHELGLDNDEYIRLYATGAI
jgi:formyl-CoA transferase